MNSKNKKQLKPLEMKPSSLKCNLGKHNLQIITFKMSSKTTVNFCFPSTQCWGTKSRNIKALNQRIEFCRGCLV